MWTAGEASKPMQIIHVERNPKAETLDSLGIFSWPVWSKEASAFPWTYDEEETCYFLEGEVEVTPEDGETVRVAKGGLAGDRGFRSG